jgi:hypothetical protein
MEPMVVCALGIVVYCGYLTVKDIIGDLRQEGFLVRPLSSRCLGCTLESAFKRLFLTRGLSRSKVVNNSFIFLRCRSAVPHTGQQQQTTGKRLLRENGIISFSGT